MVVEQQQETSGLTDGEWLMGRFLSAKLQPGKPDEKGGKWPDKFVVTILTGERTRQIEYRDERTALAAVTDAVILLDRLGLIEATDTFVTFDDVKAMTPLLLAVGTRAAQKYVFYFGRSAR